MIEVADSNAVYYYHFDALGSVVALSDSSGDTVQTYEYSVYGQVAVEDIDHPNPYMFAGRRFDIEIGLYYNRARYYNSYTGRFLQTDPIGYDDGINWYAYCGNNPVGRADPSGLYYTFLDSEHQDAVKDRITWAWISDANGTVTVINDYGSFDEWCNDSNKFKVNGVEYDDRRTIGWSLSGRNNWLFQRLQALVYLGADSGMIMQIERMGNVTFELMNGLGTNMYNEYTNTLYWDPTTTSVYESDTMVIGMQNSHG